MPILTLSFSNFRNLENKTIDFLSKEIYLVGENGQGKTNILEAIYYSAYGSSFRTHTDSEIIKNGFDSFQIKTLYKNESGATESIYIQLKDGKKSIEKNSKKIQDRKDLINTLPCVLFCHEDLEFAIGEPERRRFFIDQSLSMHDKLYIDVSRTYKKILKSRNLILKNKSYDMINVFDKQLIEAGLEIQNKRRNAIFQFNQIFGKMYEDISGISGVYIQYIPSWKITADSQNKFSEVQLILENKRDVDKTLCTTVSGPHRDHIRIMHNEKQFIATASTGQQRLAALLLRVAQAVFYTQTTGIKPVYLMDDVLLELDPDKRQRVTAMLPEYEQLFCTFLPEEPYIRYKHDTTRIYFIKDGSWYE
jgi:DNA replication and repair protein RecF